MRDRGYMKFELLPGQRVRRVARRWVRALQLSEDQRRQGSFEQSRIDARLFGEYRLSDIVGLNTTIIYDQAIGGDDIVVTADDPGDAAPTNRSSTISSTPASRRTSACAVLVMRLTASWSASNARFDEDPSLPKRERRTRRAFLVHRRVGAGALWRWGSKEPRQSAPLRRKRR